MAQYRIYLVDNADSADIVQKAVSVDCKTDDEAVGYARTLIKTGGRASLWDSDTSDRLLIGSLTLNPGPSDSADVRRSPRRHVT